MHSCDSKGVDPFHQAAWGPFIFYIITFLVFLDPPPPLGKHIFSTENKQELTFSDPPPPLQEVIT